jgi:hypothetical protein
MNQKSSLREVPQFVSGVLTANSLGTQLKIRNTLFSQGFFSFF